MSTYEKNVEIKTAVAKCYGEESQDNYLALLNVIADIMDKGGEVPTPVIVEDEAEGKYRIDTLVDGEGKQWLPFFTDEAELAGVQGTAVIKSYSIERLLRNCMTSEQIEGVVINPFTQAATLDKQMLKIVNTINLVGAMKEIAGEGEAAVSEEKSEADAQA